MYMAEPAAKEGDEISSDGTNTVWIQILSPSGKPTDSLASFTYKGSIDKSCSSNVFILSKPAARSDSEATSNSTPKSGDQLGGGTVVNTVKNNATIVKGSSTVFINEKQAVRDKDDANTWTFPSASSTTLQVTNAKVNATGSVYIGD
jgi:uncharacterized Zn-binding protein involved in type VI secretion